LALATSARHASSQWNGQTIGIPGTNPMPISEFAEILIAQTGTWLRGGEYAALRFLGPSSPL
jgi:hypothetical protein